MGYKKCCKAIISTLYIILVYAVSDVGFISPIKTKNFTCKHKLLPQFDKYITSERKMWLNWTSNCISKWQFSFHFSNICRRKKINLYQHSKKNFRQIHKNLNCLMADDLVVPVIVATSCPTRALVFNFDVMSTVNGWNFWIKSIEYTCNMSPF